METLCATCTAVLCSEFCRYTRTLDVVSLYSCAECGVSVYTKTFSDKLTKEMAVEDNS